MPLNRAQATPEDAALYDSLDAEQQALNQRRAEIIQQMNTISGRYNPILGRMYQGEDFVRWEAGRNVGFDFWLFVVGGQEIAYGDPLYDYCLAVLYRTKEETVYDDGEMCVTRYSLIQEADRAVPN